MNSSCARSQLGARVDAAVLAAQPLAVEEVRARELGPHARAPEALDRLAERALGVIALAQQRPRARLDRRAPSRSVSPGPCAASRLSASCARSSLRPHRVGCLDQLARGPSSRRPPRDARWPTRRRRAPPRIAPRRCTAPRARTRRSPARSPRRGRRPRGSSSRSGLASRSARPRHASRISAPYGAAPMPVASWTDSVSATVDAAADSSPQNTSTGVRALSASASSLSVPVSRAMSTLRSDST